MLRLTHFYFLLLCSVLFISPHSFAEEPPPPPANTEAAQAVEAELEEHEKQVEAELEEHEKEHVLVISEEALSALATQLSEEKFELLKDALLEKPFSPEIRNQILLLQDQEFTDEEVEKVHNSIDLYFGLLDKIKRVIPAISSVTELKKKIEDAEKTLDGLLKEDKETLLADIEAWRAKLATEAYSFKKQAYQLGFDSINPEKLPNMLTDLGYTDELNESIHTAIFEYLSVLKKTKTAESLIQSIEEVSSLIEEKEKEQKNASTDEEKVKISEELKKLLSRLTKLERDFNVMATGIDIETDEEEKNKNVNWEQELKDVFSPVIVQLRKVTEPSRKIELLRSNITYYEQQLPQIKDGIKQVDSLLVESHHKLVNEKLTATKEYWQQQEKEFISKLEIAEGQLIELQRKKTSPAEAFNYFTDALFSQRSKNLFFAFATFFITFFIFHLLRRFFMWANPLSRIPKYKLVANIIDVGLYLLTFIASILALVVTLYVTNEILVLGLVLLILLGVMWTLRDALPKFAEQIKLLLGYGAVRQGERVMYNDLPWLVESIGIFSYLKNPLLTGGTLRLPLKDLIDLRSREFDEKETWFPCKEGDYILINRTDWRKVILQTPNVIKFDWFEMVESMPMKNFLRQSVYNISTAPFWSGITFYISYQHRDIVLDDVVAKLNAFIAEEIKVEPYAEHIVYLWVDFAELTDTSLGVMAWLQLAPEAAPKYGNAKMRLTQICLKAANKYNWEVLRFAPVMLDKPQNFDPEQAKVLPDLNQQ